MNRYPDPPGTAQELDALVDKIDSGAGYFASLSDEQRDQLKTELSEDWIAEFLDDFPVPRELDTARRDYRAIASGERYPHLPENVRNDLLLRFDEEHGEGGPERWHDPRR